MALAQTSVWTTLGNETIQWLIQQMRANGVRSAAEIEKKKADFGSLEFEKLTRKSAVQKFAFPKTEAENFFKNMDLGLAGENVRKLTVTVQYAEYNSQETKVFKFEARKGGIFDVKYVTLRVHEGTVYLALAASTFEFHLAPTTSWWFFTENRNLTASEQQMLQNMFMYESLKTFYGAMPVETNYLSDKDKTFLDSK